VRDVETGIDLPDQLKWIKFSGASWTQGFSTAVDEPNLATKLEDVFQKLYHQLGKPQSEDVLVYERADQKSGASMAALPRMASTWLLVFGWD